MKRSGLILITAIALITSTFAEEILTTSDGNRIIIYDDFTWKYLEPTSPERDFSSIRENQPPDFLRQGVQASRDEIIRAIEMYDQGWRYRMPRPKSPQAAWGNSDGRTTWYNGWWHNLETNQYSRSTPRKGDSGLFLGDNQDASNTWRRGGSPRYPDVYMWLLSELGGPSY